MSHRDLVIQIRLPRWTWRRSAALLAALLVVAGTAVYADVQWTQYQGGEKLTSAKINANFKAMADAINALQKATPGGGMLPHLILDQGNVDLGVYLGTFGRMSGVQGGIAVTAQYPLVYLAAIQGPLVIGSLDAIDFDQANCTGNTYTDEGSVVAQWSSNLAVNTTVGTIFRRSGAPTMKTLYSVFANQKCTNFNQPVARNWIPVVDTKVMNTVNSSVMIGQTSIQMR